jgi:hypothetical protein
MWASWPVWTGAENLAPHLGSNLKLSAQIELYADYDVPAVTEIMTAAN